MKVMEMRTSVQLDTEKLVALRKRKCWTQGKLSQVSGLGERSIQRIESEGRASFQNAIALADSLEAKLEDIVLLDQAVIENSPLYELIINKKAKFYPNVTSGNELMRMIGSADLYYFDEGPLKSEEETSIVGSFFQNVRDLGDVHREIEPADRVKAARELTKEIEELGKHDLLVFAFKNCVVSKLEGQPELKMQYLSLLLLRKDSPEIITNSRGELLVAVVNEDIECKT